MYVLYANKLSPAGDKQEHFRDTGAMTYAGATSLKAVEVDSQT